MTLQDHGGQLLDVSGSLAGDPDCCCSCDCDVPNAPGTSDDCDCIEAAFGVAKSPTVTVTIGGSGNPRIITNPPAGPAQVCAAGTCPDITGDYVLGCNDPPLWFNACEFVCQDAGLGFLDAAWYVQVVRVEFTSDGDKYQLAITLYSVPTRTADETIPPDCDYDEADPPPISSLSFDDLEVRNIRYQWTTKLNHWYTWDTATCDPDACSNPVNTTLKCPLDADKTLIVDSGGNTEPTDVCTTENYTIALAFSSV